MLPQNVKEGRTDASAAPGPRAAKDHIPVLDGLRGIAIVLVMTLHIWELSWLDMTTLLHSPIDLHAATGTGFFGVDLFFFLSAFCLTLPFARHYQNEGPEPSWRHFWWRRFIKIVPSYYLSLVILLFFFPQADIARNELWFHAVTHFLFIHDWFFFTHGSLNGVLWSLGVEVQFYLLFPLLMMGFQRSRLVTLCAMAAIGQTWGAIMADRFRHDHDVMLLAWHDMQLPGYLIIFAAGMLAAWLYVCLNRCLDQATLRRLAPLFSIMTLLAIGAFWMEMQACYATRYTTYPLRYWQVQYRLLTGGTLLLFGVAAPFSMRLLQAVLANRLLVFFSILSYNLYIWHQWLARWMMDHHFPAPQTSDPHDDLRWQIVFTVLAWSFSIGLAALLTYLWERPFLRGSVPWAFLLRKTYRSVPGRER